MSLPVYVQNYPRKHVLTVRMSPEEWQLLERLMRKMKLDSLSETTRKAIEITARTVSRS